MASDITVPGWATHTLSALGGAVIVVITATMWFSSIHHTAGAALQRANDNASDIDADLRPRIRMVETQMAEYRISIKSIENALQRIEEKLNGNPK